MENLLSVKSFEQQIEKCNKQAEEISEVLAMMKVAGIHETKTYEMLLAWRSTEWERALALSVQRDRILETKRQLSSFYGHFAKEFLND